MKIKDFDFELPSDLIAQYPVKDRITSKMLTVNKETGTIVHEHFYDIVKYFNNNDVIVLNETKVLPARLFGKKAITNANIEVLLLKELENNIWEALVKPAKRIKPGDIIIFNNKLKIECINSYDEGIKTFRLIYEGILVEILEEIGLMPLPPYITKTLNEKDRYQTVYAKDLGSAAAPTAGLHFNEEIIETLKAKGVEIIKITLHVGLGTFRPVKVNNINDHQMHLENYYISEEAAEQLNLAIKNNKRITAVGTTSIRTLESNFNDKFESGKFSTNIFIYPGYKFKVVDQLITNFHLPKSTLIMLVSAFSSLDVIKGAYQAAISNKYRFFSFGDVMFLKK